MIRLSKNFANNTLFLRSDILDFLSNIVQQVITVIYSFLQGIGLANYGVAIIIMTVLVKLILYPLTKKQIESTKAMMELQPKMKAIQEKYKDDKQRLNMELANLYKIYEE